MEHPKVDTKVATSTQTVERHPTFFMEQFFVQTQNMLFQVPRIAFEGRARDGSPFAVAASLPLQQDTSDSLSMAEGTSPERPILLTVQTKDFVGLLHVMYAKGMIIPSYPSYILNHQWISALRLSTLWKFDDIRNEAIEALEYTITDPFERISLAREFRIKTWLISGYTTFITGPAAVLKPANCASKLGWETLALIFYTRDEYLKDPKSFGAEALLKHLQTGESGIGYRCQSCTLFKGTPGASPPAQSGSTTAPSIIDSDRVHPVGRGCTRFKFTFDKNMSAQELFLLPVASQKATPVNTGTSLATLIEFNFAEELSLLKY